VLTLPYIRFATEADVPAIYGLIIELAVYEREPDAVAITESDLLRDGWGPHPHFTCLVAEAAGAVCGFALYHPTYSTWQGRSLYLEDLYVQPVHRGRGIGTALLARVAAEAVRGDCARLDWSVLTWNEPALRMYQRLGAYRMEEWRRMRLSEDGLAVLAAQAIGLPDKPAVLP
jgi:GNAT superfamily N-acetyltransferase